MLSQYACRTPWLNGWAYRVIYIRIYHHVVLQLLRQHRLLRVWGRKYALDATTGLPPHHDEVCVRVCACVCQRETE